MFTIQQVVAWWSIHERRAVLIALTTQAVRHRPATCSGRWQLSCLHRFCHIPPTTTFLPLSVTTGFLLICSASKRIGERSLPSVTVDDVVVADAMWRVNWLVRSFPTYNDTHISHAPHSTSHSSATRCAFEFSLVQFNGFSDCLTILFCSTAFLVWVFFSFSSFLFDAMC